MYTSYIGKKFLRLWNEREGMNKSAEEFFNEVLYNWFFNNDKHFINVANSSFFQKLSKKDIEPGVTTHEAKLRRFHKNVKEDGPSLTTLVGYAAQDIQAGTSGQLSNLIVQPDEQEMYSSWIGIGLAISMGGGYSILIDNEEVLWGLYIGWEYYRLTLTQTPNLKGNQIEVWNSYWLIHYFSDKFNPSDPLDGFDLPDPITCRAEKWKKLGYVEFETMSWPRVIFALALKFPSKNLVVNSFKFADTNQTLGFIPVDLPEVKRFYELKDILFIDSKESILTEKELERFEPYFTFKNACTTGAIGLKVLEPDKLRMYMPTGTIPYAQGKEYNFSDKQSFYNYQIFKTWIIAMLKKTELLELAAKVAQALHTHESSDGTGSRGKTGASQFSKEFLKTKSLPDATKKLTSLLDEVPEQKEMIRNVLVELLGMPKDQFPLFITLIGFEYSYQKQNKQ